MPQSIETFVARLQEEGIQAGRQEAQRLIQQAQAQARQTLEQADQQARQIIDQANQQARQALDRGQAQLSLACRDSILRLRDALGAALRGVLARQVETELSDPAFLRQALGQLVQLYAQADLENRQFEVRVGPELVGKLSDWAIQEIGARQGDGRHAGIDLKGTLAQAGFEYRVDGATIEVTVESVVQLLSELVSPRLREVLQQAAGQLGRES
jgi:V/A-type H+-transporting ATPase subunit E